MMVNNRQDPGFKEEEKNLQALEEKISSIVNTINSEIKINQQKMITERDTVVIKHLDQENIQYKIEALNYEKQKPNPYFARMSFLANGKNETYVIGRKGLNDYEQKSDIIVVDWRTPFGQAFNQKSRNKFEFGGESYILTLRRAVNIKNAKLVSYNDEYTTAKSTNGTPSTGYGNEVQNGSDRKSGTLRTGTTPTTETDSSNIVDPFLLELLTDQRRQNAVTDIIATIQEKQNDIISQPYNKNFIVQGCSGSGKTMILLHRLSYLIFNKLQEQIDLNNIRIVTPNKDFSYFIDDLMHQLDLEKIPVMPVEELYVELIKRVTTGLEAERNPISDTVLPVELIRRYYSDDFLAEIVRKYNDYWQSIITEIREIASDKQYDALCTSPDQYSHSGYQSIFEVHSRDSRIVESINRDVEEARTRFDNAPAAIRTDILNRLEQIPKEVETIFEEKQKFLDEKKENEKKYQNNLPKRARMDAFQEYERYRFDPESPIAKAIYNHNPAVIDEINEKIRENEKKLASVPDYAFVQKYEINRSLQELKDKYRTKAREALDQWYQKFDEWQSAISNCDEKIRDLDARLGMLQELELSIKRLQEKFIPGKTPEELRQDPEYEKWEMFLAPYFEAKEAFTQAELRRDSSTEYKRFKKISLLLENLKQDAVYKNVYETLYLSDVKDKRNSNEQFHFELFLKLHFCLRYFGPLSARMFINIDEGQVLNITEYLLLRNYLGRETVLNIYGDINQKIDYSTGITSWNEIADGKKIFVLNENYRNTKQVTEFCNERFFSKLIPIGIEGPDVKQLSLQNAVNWIIEQHERYPEERCAIIYDGSRKNKAAIENLVKGRKDVLWKFSDKSGIFVLSADLSRGLEFENVVVFDMDMSIGGKYISYTRSLNQLIVVSDYEPGNPDGQSTMVTMDTNTDDSDDPPNLNPDDLISQEDFVRKVNVQPETIERYIREGQLIPDLVIKVDGKRTENYFREETLKSAADRFKWELLDESNRKEQFMKMVKDMKMSASYKPVLLNGFFKYADRNGRAKLKDLIRYFRWYYEDRRARGLIVEKPSSIFAKNKCSYNEIEKLILTMPFKRFEDMGMMHYDSKNGIVEMDPSVWENLTEDEKKAIPQYCNNALVQYYLRFVK